MYKLLKIYDNLDRYTTYCHFSTCCLRTSPQ